jgi:hypothetical protein
LRKNGKRKITKIEANKGRTKDRRITEYIKKKEKRVI